MPVAADDSHRAGSVVHAVHHDRRRCRFCRESLRLAGTFDLPQTPARGAMAGFGKWVGILSITELSRIRSRDVARKVLSADEAAALIPEGSTIGMSGFTGSGKWPPLRAPTYWWWAAGGTASSLRPYWAR
jgi:hypothetical protein